VVTARLTPAEARALGLLDGTPTVRAAKVRTTSKRARAPYHSVCCKCQEVFTTEKSEERHDAATRHARYRLVL
jgi:hypothetical protein